MVVLKKVGESRQLMYGNKSVIKGAIASDMEFYAAYPMTPASTLLSEVIADGSIPYIQPEDEIAVAMAGLGSAFTGKRTMVGTSGGGFALMTEALSYSVQAEIPLVVALSMRSGPSTGTPTCHEQGDINFALNPTFGDFNHIVLCPSSIEEGYRLAGQALNHADTYQQFVMFLIDRQFSEGYTAVSTDQLVGAPVQRGKIESNPSEDYARYALTEDGISPRVMVGTENGDFMAPSYEHDIYGATSEDQSVKVAMTEKRFHKLDNFFEKEGIQGYEVINPDAKKMFVVFSFTTYVVKDFLRDHPQWGAIVVTYFKPLDTRMRSVIEGLDRLVFVENNISGQFENYVRKELALDTIATLSIDHIRKYDNMPIYREDLDNKAV